MNLKFYLSVVLMLFLVRIPAFSFLEEVSMAELGLVGPVKTCKTVKYAIVQNGDKQEKGDLIASNIFNFNEQGELTSQITEDVKGNRQVLVVKYNNKGKKIEEKNFVNDNLLSYAFFNYDRENRLIKESGYENNETIYKLEYTYDTEGNQIKDIRYDETNEDVTQTHYKYDSDKKLAEKDVYMRNDYNNKMMLTEKHVYKYQEGQLIEEFVNFYLHIQGKTTISSEKHRFVYNLAGNVLEETSYNSKNELTSKKIYKYGKEGRLETELAENYRIDYKEAINYRYNARGILSEKYTGRQTGNTIFYSSYRYDENGNWIELINSSGKDRKAVAITEQTLEYYK